MYILSMDTTDTNQPPVDASDSHQSIQCTDCASALQSPGRENISFLLLDELTIPLVGCDDHLEQFRSICSLATEDSGTLLGHHPAGGLPCPGCRHTAYDMQHPVIPLGDGALAVLACTTHQSDIVARFRAGMQIQTQLSGSLDAF